MAVINRLDRTVEGSKMVTPKTLIRWTLLKSMITSFRNTRAFWRNQLTVFYEQIKWNNIYQGKYIFLTRGLYIPP